MERRLLKDTDYLMILVNEYLEKNEIQLKQKSETLYNIEFEDGTAIDCNLTLETCYHIIFSMLRILESEGE